MNYNLLKPIYDALGLAFPGTYMTILFFAFSLTFPIVAITAVRLKMPVWRQILFPIFVIPSALIFSRVFHILFEGMFMDYMHGLWENGIGYLFSEMLNPFKPGHVFYGGLFGGFLAGALMAIVNYPGDWAKFKKTADAAAIVVANGLWITRIGCFFEGCCFGRPSSIFGIHFPQGSKTMFMLYQIDPEHTSLFTETQPIIPTQLIHSGLNLIIFGVLIKLMFTGKEKKPGYIASIFLLSYSVARFMVEFLRYDIRGSFLFFSTSQWISIILFILGWKLYSKTKLT